MSASILDTGNPEKHKTGNILALTKAYILVLGKGVGDRKVDD